LSAGRIIIVDDQPKIRRFMRTTLVAEGYEVDEAKTGEQALESIRELRPDLVVLRDRRNEARRRRGFGERGAAARRERPVDRLSRRPPAPRHLYTNWPQRQAREDGPELRRSRARPRPAHLGAESRQHRPPSRPRGRLARTP